MNKLALAAALLFIPAGAAVAQPPPPPPPPADTPPPAPERAGSLALPAGFSRESVKDAIVAALAHREWTVVASERGSVRAHLLHRKKDCTLIFQFDASHLDIFSDSYVVDGAGFRTSRIIPNDWIENLEQDIREYIAHLPQR